jgi:hypothetical protein
MSAHLRTEARASGWPNNVVRNLSVRHQDGEFTVHSHEGHRDQVLDLEYGTPSTQPTAAIRRFANRQQEAEKFLVGRVGKHMGGHR